MTDERQQIQASTAMAQLRCNTCGEPIAGVHTSVGANRKSDSTVTDVANCPDHPNAEYVLSVEVVE